MALDIGGTKINAALVRIRGGDAEIVETATTPTVASDGHGGVLAAAVRVAEEVLAPIPAPAWTPWACPPAASSIPPTA